MISYKDHEGKNSIDPCLGIGMRMGFSCEIVSMDNQLGLRLSMTLRLRFILLSLSHHFAWKLLLCSTSLEVRRLLQHNHDQDPM